MEKERETEDETGMAITEIKTISSQEKGEISKMLKGERSCEFFATTLVYVLWTSQQPIYTLKPVAQTRTDDRSEEL